MLAGFRFVKQNETKGRIERLATMLCVDKEHMEAMPARAGGRNENLRPTSCLLR